MKTNPTLPLPYALTIPAEPHSPFPQLLDEKEILPFVEEEKELTRLKRKREDEGSRDVSGGPLDAAQKVSVLSGGVEEGRAKREKLLIALLGL